MSRYLDTSTETHMAKIMVQCGRPSRSSWAKPVRSSSGSTIMGKAIRESSIRTRLGKGSKLGMFFVKREKRTILVRVFGRYKTGWEETKHWPNVARTYGRSWFGWTDIIPWPRSFDLHSTRMRNKQRYCAQLQKYVWIQDLRRSKRRATLFRETWRKHFLMVLWCGRSCKEMCGATLRTGEQNNSTAMYWRPWS